MIKKLKYSEWIEQYNEGELDDVQVKEFESELSSNTELAFEYDLDKDLTKAISEAEIVDFRKILNEVQDEVNQTRESGAKLLHLARKYWYAAASIILIIAIAGSVLLLGPQDYSNEKLFQMYYTSVKRRHASW
jgi:NADH pyrophosphatase NudC (nudix superfamily)